MIDLNDSQYLKQKKNIYILALLILMSIQQNKHSIYIYILCIYKHENFDLNLAELKIYKNQ